MMVKGLKITLARIVSVSALTSSPWVHCQSTRFFIDKQHFYKQRRAEIG